MATKEPAQTQQQPANGWGWGSINNFVENTKKSSESFFDNMTATLSKKEQKQNIVINRNIKRTIVHQHQQLPPSQAPKVLNPPRTELDQWKLKYMELKNASSQKITILSEELQKYKEHNINLNRLISQETDPKIKQLESQIAAYRENEKKCMYLCQQQISEYFANTDDLQHEIEEKYKIFYEKLLNVTIKAGLNPNDIFRRSTAQHHSDDAMSVISDFEEKDNKQKSAIHVIKEVKVVNKENEKKIQQYELKVVDLEGKLKEFERKFFKEIEKNQRLSTQNDETNGACKELTGKLTQLMGEYDQQRLKYMDLEQLFGGMSDQNTEFQQQIKDVRGENELLRQQLSHCNSQLTKNQVQIVCTVYVYIQQQRLR